MAAVLPSAGESSFCPAPPEDRRLHATPVLAVGERPWAMAPLPTHPPPLPSVSLPPPNSEERRQLVRRLTLVLSGLPPREDDVEAFQADRSPRALDKVLDRLLAAATAPQRLTEVWLRATGYVDRWPVATVPPAAQPGDAWRYRDWVVGALRGTRDVRSLARLTLAGDSRPGAETGVPHRDGLLATQWHLFAVPASADYERTVIEWSGQQAERTARVFLGIDLTCARCHDHPSLPLPSEEAAGLVAIFAHSRAYAPAADGTPAWNQISVAAADTLRKHARTMKALEEEEAALEAKRREFALIVAAEFLPQTAEYVRAAWAWHRKPAGTLAAFAATRGLLEEPLARWLDALGLAGAPPAHSLNAPWWTAWTTARKADTPEAIATAARAVQETHQADAHSPFFSTSPAMDAFFTLDQQAQIARLAEKVTAVRRTLPEAVSLPALGEGAPAGMEPPAMPPSLPAILAGGSAPAAIAPPGAGRRALATWLEGEGARFFARLAAVYLSEGLGHPLIGEPSTLAMWSAKPPPDAGRIDSVAAALVAGGWPAAAKRTLLLQVASPSRKPLMLGGSEWRDAVLFAAGTLDPRQGGPPDAAPDSVRRGLYREWAPFPAPPTAGFLETQADALAALARRKAGPDAAVQLTWLTHHLFQRPPTPAERTAFQTDPDSLATRCADLLRSEEFRTFP